VIILDDKHLMMIEPQGPKTAPLDDDLTDKAKAVFAACTPGDALYKGFHLCKCLAMSDNGDHITPEGRVTNSLLVHYISEHRAEVPKDDLVKLLKEFYSIPTPK
jgi:hypothetical protein